METALPLNAFVKSDIAFTASFDSSEITLDDAIALVGFLKGVMEGAQFEIAERTGLEFEILPVVSVSQGSIKFRVDVRPSHWTITVRTTAREVFLAIALLLDPNSVVTPPQPPPQPVSSQCEEMVRAKYDETLRAWEFFGKGFKGEFEMSCGNTTIKSTVNVPQSRPR